MNNLKKAQNTSLHFMLADAATPQSFQAARGKLLVMFGTGSIASRVSERRVTFAYDEETVLRSSEWAILVEHRVSIELERAGAISEPVPQ